ncbi:MAG: flagellar hook-basal body complex protein FliE [Pseudomonadota bacterium]
MTINPTDAIRAFNDAARLGGAGLDARDKPTSTFAEMLGKVAGDSMEASKTAETLTTQAVTGDAELLDVVSAVSNAEVTLQTVMAVRDRVMSAYQEILRMPI